MGDLKHPNDMTQEELLDLVWSMSWAALDLAQHLAFCEILKPEYQENAYKRATKMAYKLVDLWESEPDDPTNQIFYFGENGLEKR